MLQPERLKMKYHSRFEQTDDREARQTPLGLFNMATAYRAAAQKLDETKLKTVMRHAPIRFLYFHALELYLKAFLRAHGCSLSNLEKLGHDYRKLLLFAAKFNLEITEVDRNVLIQPRDSDAPIESRYIRT